MARIKLTPEMLNEQANKLIQYANQNDEVVQNLDSITSSLQGWEGTAQEAFFASYNQKRATFVSFTDALREFAQKVINFSDVMKGEEERQTRVAQELGA